MMPLRLEWSRCPDGVELVGESYRPRSGRRVPVTYDLTNLEDSIAIRFVNTKDDAAAKALFLGRFGMPTSAEYVTQDQLDEQHMHVVGMLFVDADDGPAVVAANVNEGLRDAATKLVPAMEVVGDGSVRIVASAGDLLSLMMMEMAFAAEVGAQIGVCGHCETIYFTGPLTGRRSHAKYCSDRCRVAAMRKRNSMGGEDGTR